MDKTIISKLTDAVLKGSSLVEAANRMFLTEAVIDALSVENFVRSSTYRHLEQIAMEILKVAENDVEFEKNSGMSKEQGMEFAIDHMFYVRNFLQSLHLKNFPDSVKKQLNKSITTLRKSEATAEAALKKAAEFPDGWEDVDGKIRTQTLNPVMYCRRALEALVDVFNAMNIPWDYDPTWQNYLKNPGDSSKGKAKYDAQGNREVDYKVPEKVLRVMIRRIKEAKSNGTFADLQRKMEGTKAFDAAMRSLKEGV